MLFGPEAGLNQNTRNDGSVRIFDKWGDKGWEQDLELFDPGAIAGTKKQLFELAGSPVRPELTHAVICLGRQSDPLLTEEERQRLWRVFEVPVFEQIIGPQGELLASECEAHDGLHIHVPEFTLDIETEEEPPRSFHIETKRCACGRRSPRLTFQTVTTLAQAATR